VSPVRHALVAAAAAALALAPSRAAAARTESPRQGSFEIGAGTYYPDIDSGCGTALNAAAGTAPTCPFPKPGPYEQVFGTKRGWMFRLGVSRALFTTRGALEIGFRTGYFHDSGKALQKNNDTGTISDVQSGDSTTFNVIPTSLTLSYRFDLLADRYDIPLAPYARVALERYNWWTTTVNASSTTGATNGWSWTAGLALQLDFFDPQLAREMDIDTGINHTYLFFDVTKSNVDDFGSSKSLDLSDKSYSLAGGLMFVF
jgi:hypothetical protein